MNVVNDTLTTYGLSDKNLFWQILDIMPSTNRFEVYFIDGFGNDDVVGRCSMVSRSRGLVVKASAGSLTLAHEIGHFFGLHDIFYMTANQSGAICAELMQNVKDEWQYWDWNNGSGSCFYAPELKQHQLISRLLMYGVEDDASYDIPAGPVYGKPFSGELRDVSVGRMGMDLTQ